MSLLISTSIGSVFWVFYDYEALYLIISVLLPRLFCFYIYCIFSAILKIPMRVFLMPVRGAGYTFYPLSINRVGFFLSMNREKIRLFPSDFIRTYF